MAAIATCLHAWHSAHGSLHDEAAIRDRSQPKFRLLAGDLSGIQRTLFKLAQQQVKGVSRILRARSFLMGMLTEAAAFTGADFFPPRYQQVQDQLHQRLETVKLQPLHGQATGVHLVDYPHGVCPACDRRPAAIRDLHDAELYRMPSGVVVSRSRWLASFMPWGSEFAQQHDAAQVDGLAVVADVGSDEGNACVQRQCMVESVEEVMVEFG